MVGDVSGKSLQTAKEHGFSRFPIFGDFLWDADVLLSVNADCWTDDRFRGTVEHES